METFRTENITYPIIIHYNMKLYEETRDVHRVSFALVRHLLREATACT